MSDLPLVSCVIAAYNYARYLEQALDSVLAQDYPANRLEIIVVDDGSTDETPAVLARHAERNPGRIRVIRQENAGVMVATQRGLDAASGDLIALLDADDLWLPHKTRAQVELLAARAEVGLVYGDMLIVDADGGWAGTALTESLGIPLLRGRLRARLMQANVVTTSTIMMRASLRALYDPLPSINDMYNQDWWFAAQVAKRAELDFVEVPVAMYRRHGSNKSSQGAAIGELKLREARIHLDEVRCLLAHTDAQEISPTDIARLVEKLESQGRHIKQTSYSKLAAVTTITDEHRAAAKRELETQGRAVDRLFACARAFGHDPTSLDVRTRLLDVLGEFTANAAGVIAANVAEFGARPVLAFAEAAELLTVPELWNTIAALPAQSPATVAIAIDQGTLDETASALQSAVTAHGMAGEDGPQMLAFACPPVVAQQLPVESVQAIVTATGQRAAIPCFGVGEGQALRAFVERAVAVTT